MYVNVLKHIYKQAKSFIRLHKDSKPFQVSRGVRQGDTSSPKLFTACLEIVFRKLNWSRRGILIDGEYHSHLRFADDIIIFTCNIAELHEMLQELNQASLEVGLSMNFKKTKIMCNKHAEDTNRKITIDNNEIEEVDHYIYLGQRISMETASKEQEITAESPLDGKHSEELVPFSRTKKFQPASNVRFTTNASFRQSPTDLKRGI